jgi:hypothetical protein
VKRKKKMSKRETTKRSFKSMIFFRGKWGFEKLPSDAIQKVSK